MGGNETSEERKYKQSNKKQQQGLCRTPMVMWSCFPGGTNAPQVAAARNNRGCP